MKIRFLNGLLLVALLMTSLLTATGCDQLAMLTGTGPITTRAYDLSGFNRVEVSSAFEMNIAPSDNYSISVTAYQNLFDYIEVYTNTDTLFVRLKPGSFTSSAHRVAITLPTLTYLSLSGASHGTAREFVSSTDLTLNLSGASYLDTSMTTGKSKIDLSGASKLKGTFTATDASMKITGASRIETTGSVQTLDIDVSGASTADLFDFKTQDAQIKVSGASTLNLTANGKLDADVSGASTLNYKGTAIFGKNDVSGASSINKK